MKSSAFKQITFGVVAILTILTTIAACKKEKEDNHEPTNSATITIVSPKQDTAYDKGDTVKIVAQVNSIESMHGWEITVRNLQSNVVVLKTNDEAHGTSLSLNENWVNNVTSQSQMDAEIMVVLDHDKNTATKKVKFQCNP